MLQPITNKTKCDVRDCKNNAEYQFAIKGRAGRCYLCSKCLSDIAGEGLAPRVPKSPQNTIKKKMELKNKEQNYDDKQ